MATYKTPGVYVEEISTLPPSVAEVSTAVPAFIGYTAIGPTPDAQGKVIPVVSRINTLLEYEKILARPTRVLSPLPPLSIPMMAIPPKSAASLAPSQTLTSRSITA